MIDPKRIIKGMAVLAACVFLIIYMYHQIIGVQKVSLETETALAVNLEKSISATGYIARTESVIKNNGSGTVFAVVKDGEKVAGGNAVANVYKTESDADSKAKIDQIDEKLEILESSIVDQEYFSADVTKLEKDKNEILKNVIKNKANNNYTDCISKKNSLLISMNKLSTVKSGSSFDAKIKELLNEKSRLSGAGSADYTRIYAPVSGYYSGIVDGFEETFLPATFEKMTISEFDALVASSPNQDILSGNAGKLVLDSRWYLMCKLDKNECASFDTGKNYTVLFPLSQNFEIKMKLFRIITETDKTEAVLIFTSNTVPDNFDFTRVQNIRIVSESYSGLKVPKSAMRMLDDGTKGVYILVGETVHFRRAEEIYQIDNYYIVREETDEEKQAENKEQQNSTDEIAETDQTKKSDSPYSYIELYDNVIVGGKGLFDGKRIEH